MPAQHVTLLGLIIIITFVVTRYGSWHGLPTKFMVNRNRCALTAKISCQWPTTVGGISIHSSVLVAASHEYSATVTESMAVHRNEPRQYH
jgi:hypothetical protein